MPTIAFILAIGIFTTATAAEDPRPLPSRNPNAPDRSGFTFLLNFGLGYQNDTDRDDPGMMRAQNRGLGRFLRDDLALMFRLSYTNVSYESTRQTASTLGPTLQQWVNDRLYVEAGVGASYWSRGHRNGIGFGLNLGSSYSIWNQGRHSLFVGAEYAPVFTDDPVHNAGLVFGWQLLPSPEPLEHHEFLK